MDSKRGLGRIISALLAATSVIGQAGAAPKAKKKEPVSAPAALNRKVGGNKRGGVKPAQGSFEEVWYKEPRNIFDAVLGASLVGVSGYALYERHIYDKLVKLMTDELVGTFISKALTWDLDSFKDPDFVGTTRCLKFTGKKVGEALAKLKLENNGVLDVFKAEGNAVAVNFSAFDAVKVDSNETLAKLASDKKADVLLCGTMGDAVIISGDYNHAFVDLLVRQWIIDCCSSAKLIYIPNEIKERRSCLWVPNGGDDAAVLTDAGLLSWLLELAVDKEDKDKNDEAKRKIKYVFNTMKGWVRDILLARLAKVGGEKNKEIKK